VNPQGSTLEDEARAWAQENPEQAPPPPASPATPAPGAAPASSSPPVQPAAPVAQASASDDDDDEQPVSPEEAAEFAVALLDIVLTNFVSERLEFKPKQHAKLVKLGTPLARKYMPDVSDVASPEIAFAVGLAAICAKNYLTTPDPATAHGSPAGGTEGTGGSSGGPVGTTPANVDGKNVNAEVLQ
jgi:hypothetical protein